MDEKGPGIKQVAPASGLTTTEAQARLAKYGENIFQESHVSPWRKFLAYFWGGIPWMIEIAAILSALARRREDFTVIASLLLINAGVGFWEEFTRPTMPSRRLNSILRPWPACCGTERGATYRHASWCSATWYSCASGPLCRLMSNWRAATI